MSVELHDEQVLLRAPRSTDAGPLCEAALESVDQVGRWLPWCHAAYSHADAAAWISTCLMSWHREEAYPFFIFDRAGGALVGGCALNEIDRPRLRANLGYWIRSGRMGHGLATAAARLLARFALETLAMQRIEIVAAVGNLASQRVAAKLGAVPEGLWRNRLRIRDMAHDAYGFSLIPSDLANWPR
jgi:RimJ/RimL family protein N-acetyltransferase